MRYKVKFRLDDALSGRTEDREKIDDLLKTLSTIEAEILYLKRRIGLLEEEISRIKRENQNRMSELQRARTVKMYTDLHPCTQLKHAEQIIHFQGLNFRISTKKL